MPRLIYGTAWKKDDTARLVRTALAAGFRGIDTACQPKHYHEAGVGEGIADSSLARADLYLQTKFTPLSGQDPSRVPYDPRAAPAEQVAQSFRASLANLRVTCLDGLILHSPVREAEIWQAMETIADGGRVRQLGISNCYDLHYLEALYRAARIKPALVQNRFYADTGYDRAIRAYCRRQGIVYQSFWTLSANPGLLAHATLRALAAAHRRTPAQVLFRYLTQVGVVPLTGTRSELHMREDLAIFGFELAHGELASLHALLEASGPGFRWDDKNSGQVDTDPMLP
jgi:diketogulonate reductase-like aldo/keto reductase